MGFVLAKRPVVLVVEDEFLLRMDAADMIAAAGFEVVEAADADAAIEILEARKIEARASGPGPMASNQDHCNLRRPCRRKRSARGRTVPAEALQLCTDCGRVATVNG